MKIKNYKELLQHITTLIFDYDGVLTDGSVLAMENGDLLRVGHVRDGYALHLALKNGYNVAVISGGNSYSIVKRCESIGISDVFINIGNKMETFQNYLKQKNASLDQVLYMGDDIPDYQVMKLAGLSACPVDAAEEIKAISNYISHYKGGHGCVRDIIEQIMKIHGKWMNDDAFEW